MEKTFCTQLVHAVIIHLREFLKPVVPYYFLQCSVDTCFVSVRSIQTSEITMKLGILPHRSRFQCRRTSDPRKLKCKLPPSAPGKEQGKSLQMEFFHHVIGKLSLGSSYVQADWIMTQSLRPLAADDSDCFISHQFSSHYIINIFLFFTWAEKLK